jgi:hypothetical protein
MSDFVVAVEKQHATVETMSNFAPNDEETSERQKLDRHFYMLTREKKALKEIGITAGIDDFENAKYENEDGDEWPRIMRDGKGRVARLARSSRLQRAQLSATIHWQSDEFEILDSQRM